MVRHIIIAVCGLAFAAAGLAKLPPPTPEQQAAAALNAAKAAHADKVDAYTLCVSQTKVADAYIKEQKAQGKVVHARSDARLRESRSLRAAGGDAGSGRCPGATRRRCSDATCSDGRQEVAVSITSRQRRPVGRLCFSGHSRLRARCTSASRRRRCARRVARVRLAARAGACMRRPHRRRTPARSAVVCPAQARQLCHCLL